MPLAKKLYPQSKNLQLQNMFAIRKIFVKESNTFQAAHCNWWLFEVKCAEIFF